jgi:hypothetical protein
MGNMVLREPWSNRMFFIALHAPFWDAGTGNDIYPFDGLLDRAMLAHRAPVGFDIARSPVERLTHQRRSERSITAYEFGELYDGYVMHARPLKEAVGTTCVSDWILTEDELRHFWRNLPNKAASERFSRVPLAEFRRDFCRLARITAFSSVIASAGSRTCADRERVRAGSTSTSPPPS